jgi:hypothetical protein
VLADRSWGDRDATVTSQNRDCQRVWLTISNIRPACDLSGKVPTIFTLSLSRKDRWWRSRRFHHPIVRYATTSTKSGIKNINKLVVEK